MNDYKELLEELRAHCLCITNGDNCNNCEGLISEKAYCRLQIELHKKAADAIEQLTKERDAAIATIPHKCWSCGKGYHTEKGFECEETWYKGNNPDCLSWEWRGVTDAN